MTMLLLTNNLSSWWQKTRDMLWAANAINPYVFAGFMLVLAISLGLLVHWVFIRSLKVIRRKSRGEFIASLLENLTAPTQVFFPLFLIRGAQLVIGLEEPYDTILLKITQSALIISLGWVLIKLLSVAEDVVSYRYTQGNYLKERRIKTQLQFTKRMFTVVLTVIVLSVLLLTFDEVRKIGSTLLTTAGVAGIIVGFAAQQTIANFLAGLQIAFTQPIKLDDAVIVEGEWGTVEEITLTYVVVKVWDKRRIILPINYFIEKPFQNWTKSSSELVGVIMLYVDYTLPLDALREELDRILTQEPLWDGTSKGVQVVETSERTMHVRVLVSALSAGTTFTLRCNVREKLIDFIRNHYAGSLPQNRISWDHPPKLTRETPTEVADEPKLIYEPA